MTKSIIIKLFLLNLMILFSVLSFGQTPVSEDDLPPVKLENVAGVTVEEIVALLNTNFKVIVDGKQKLDVLVLKGKFVQGKIETIKVETLGMKVDSAITNTIVRTMRNGYDDLLSRKGNEVDHEFGFTFNFDFGRNQLSNYMKVETVPLGKD